MGSQGRTGRAPAGGGHKVECSVAPWPGAVPSPHWGAGLASTPGLPLGPPACPCWLGVWLQAATCLHCHRGLQVTPSAHWHEVLTLPTSAITVHIVQPGTRPHGGFGPEAVFLPQGNLCLLGGKERAAQQPPGPPGSGTAQGRLPDTQASRSALGEAQGRAPHLRHPGSCDSGPVTVLRLQAATSHPLASQPQPSCACDRSPHLEVRCQPLP